MAARAFQPSAVRDEPKIHQCRPAKVGKSCPPLIDNQDRGDVLVRGLWEKGTDCIIDVRVTNTDATYYALKPSDNVLEAAEKLKEKKYLQACLEQRRHFTPFVVSANGLLVKEAKTVLKVLEVCTATKAGKSYSNVMGASQGPHEHCHCTRNTCVFEGVSHPYITDVQQTPPVGGPDGHGSVETLSI
jgi:hypothetical protein